MSEPAAWPLGTILLDAEGDEWEWLADCIPNPLPIGRAWLRDTRGPYLRTRRGSTTMPWTHPDPMRSAQRYGPFRPVE